MKAKPPRPVALVTGASGGMGRAICLKLAHIGYDIIGHYNARSREAESLQEEIRSLGGDCVLVRADLRASNAVNLIVAAVDDLLGTETGKTISALVNGAALMLGPAFDAATPEEFDRFFAINTRAPFFIAQQIAERMGEGGSIVNISSAGVHFSSPGDIVYAMTKAALEALTFHSAEQLAARGIRINTLIPGLTDNGHDLFRVPEARAHMESFAVLGGVSSPATVADAVAFLVSSESCRTTGTTLDVSGGSTLATGRKSSSNFSLRNSLEV